jgi:uncharacterized SAM-binding protein YcdF (DUF218 family)
MHVPTALLRPCRGLGILVVLGFSLAAFTPGVRWIVGWLAGPPRLERADAIVVLGAGAADAGQALGAASFGRMLHAVALYRTGLAPILIASGSPNEVAARVEIARALGVPASALMTEARGRTTREEALFIRDRLAPRGVRRVLLVADTVDSPRAKGTFERVGLGVLSAPTDLGAVTEPDGRLGLAREALSEWVARAYYALWGYL